MSNWLISRLSERSTYIGLILGLATALEAFVPEIASIAEAVVPILAAYEVAREE